MSGAIRLGYDIDVNGENKCWVGERKTFMKEFQYASDPVPVTIMCRIQQRSDGVLYYMTWERDLPSYADKIYKPEQIPNVLQARKEAREVRWDHYLKDIASVEPARLYEHCAIMRSRGWTEVTV